MPDTRTDRVTFADFNALSVRPEQFSAEIEAIKSKARAVVEDFEALSEVPGVSALMECYEFELSKFLCAYRHFRHRTADIDRGLSLMKRRIVYDAVDSANKED